MRSKNALLLDKNSLRKPFSGLFGMLIVLIVFSSTASAVDFGNGDVFVGVGNGFIKQFDSLGNLKNTLDTGTGCGEDLGMGFDSTGNLYATAAFGSCGTGTVTKFDKNGNLTGPFGSGYGASTESIAIDAAQNVYVGQPDSSPISILGFNSTGTPLPGSPFIAAAEDRGTDWIDLAADQCTMFYTSEFTHVKRFNVCTSTQMSDFNAVALPGQAFALRILPTGEVIVADKDSIILLDASGTPEKTYLAPSDFDTINDFLFAMTLDPDGTHFWTASFFGGNVYRYDFANTTGPDREWNADKQGVFGLAVFRAFTVSKDFRFTNVSFCAIPAELGTLLPQNGSKFNVTYVTKPKDGTVSSTNPGQLYGVITINGFGAQNVSINDTFGTQFNVNPAKLGGGVEVLRVNTITGVATDITNTPQVRSASVDNTNHTVNLSINLTAPLAGDEKLMIYVKFQTALKGMLPDTNDFVNKAGIVINGATPQTATATINFVTAKSGMSEGDDKQGCEETSKLHDANGGNTKGDDKQECEETSKLHDAKGGK